MMPVDPESEYYAAFHDAVNNPIFRHLYMELAESTKLLLHGDHDVFGDGSVVILSALTYSWTPSPKAGARNYGPPFFSDPIILKQVVC